MTQECFQKASDHDMVTKVTKEKLKTGNNKEKVKVLTIMAVSGKNTTNCRLFSVHHHQW